MLTSTLTKAVSMMLSVTAVTAVTAASAEDACPVTIGADIDFRQPWPEWRSWYGTESLAVMLPVDGVWPTTKPGSLISVKLFWYSSEFQALADDDFGGGEVPFTARIRRLDSGPDDAVISSPNWAGLGDLGANWTMLTGIDFPSAGCWEINGGYLDQSLTFIVETIDHQEWRERF